MYWIQKWSFRNHSNMLIWCSNLFLFSILRTYFYRNRSPFLWLWLSESSIELFCTIACLYYHFWWIECILDEFFFFSLKLSMGRLTPTCGSLISGTEIRELWWKVKSGFWFKAIDQQQHISICGLTHQAHRSQQHNGHLSGSAPACRQMGSLC